MIIKTIVDEDFVNYQKPAMFIGTAHCNGKCCIEGGFPLSVCQNDGWRKSALINFDDEAIIKRYLQNPLTQSIVFGGLEPMEQSDELLEFVRTFRVDHSCSDDIVIYTGYNHDEVASVVEQLRAYENIIIKFGRYVPGDKPHLDEVLGTYLASDNQYAVRL